MSAHPALAKMGQLALMVLTATLVRAPPGLEGRTARRVSDGVGRGGGGRDGTCYKGYGALFLSSFSSILKCGSIFIAKY